MNKLVLTPLTHEDIRLLTARVIISLCALIIFSAVFINFISRSRGQKVKHEKKSFVATASMTLFFFLLYVLIHGKTGVLHVASEAAQTSMAVVGLILVVIGCAVNITGRMRLGGNWANQATIYEDQKLVVSGVFSVVRHPLYASLIWMFYGASIVYANLAAFLATSFVFVPFMFHRARLEEALLAAEFDEYEDYRKKVCMFIPCNFSRLLNGGSEP